MNEHLPDEQLEPRKQQAVEDAVGALLVSNLRLQAAVRLLMQIVAEMPNANDRLTSMMQDAQTNLQDAHEVLIETGNSYFGVEAAG